MSRDLSEGLLHNESAYTKLAADREDKEVRDSVGSDAAPVSSSLSAVAVALRSHRKLIIVVVAAVVLLLLVAAVYFVVRKEEEESPAPPPNSATPWLSLRLPSSVTPDFYELALTVDLDGLHFWGNVSISLQATAAASIILLHALALDIQSVSLYDAAAARSLATSYWLYPDNSYLVIQLEQGAALSIGVGHQLRIGFRANLTNNLAGLYYSTYQDARGSHRIATTQFEPTDARRAFPCFDEPAMKANFSIAITAPDIAPVTLTNTPLQHTDYNVTVGASTLWYRSQFVTTPRMSTYLVCIIVCDFSSTAVISNNKVLFRTWAAPDRSPSTINASITAAAVTDVYDEVFAIKYPLPKQDQAAIPDFAAGAMENWGLVTYRETLLLYDSALSSDQELQGMVRVIAHELAHQWFGDLVRQQTAQCSAAVSALWLNEGFATWVSILGMDRLYPSWQSWAQFYTDTAVGALTLDSLPSSHPIVDPEVQSPDRINSHFDAISYNKGGCLLQHMMAFLSYPTFISAIRSYLRQHAYGNANSGELMTQLTAAAGGRVNVTEVMSAYLLQPNYPLVHLSERVNPADGNGSWTVNFTVTQLRYLSPPGTVLQRGHWHVPINWVIRQADGSSINSSVHWLRGGEQEQLELPLVFDYTQSLYLKLNSNADFFYRVLYPHFMYDQYALTLLADPDLFTVKDRTSLIDDAFSLAYAGLLPWQFALNLTRYAGSQIPETQLPAWTELIAQWTALLPYFKVAGEADFLNTYVGALMQQQYADVSGLLNTGNHVQNLLTSRIFAAATRFDVSDSRNRARELFKAYVDSGFTTRPWADIISTVLTVGMAEADVSVWDRVYQQWTGANSAADSARFLAALASTKDVTRVTRLLNLAVDGTIRIQDAATAITNVLQDGDNWEVVWNWLTTHWDALFNLLESGYAGLGRVVGAVVSGIQEQQRLDTVQAFFSTKKLGTAAAAYSSALHNAQKNIAFRQGPYKAVRDWIVEFTLPSQQTEAS